MIFGPILERLDKIVALLEYQTFGPKHCLHRNTKDIGKMGDKPGLKLQCKDCGMVLEK